MPRLADVIAVLDAWFDPRWAEPWDAVGLVCGDPEESVERVLLAVDAVPATVEEAVSASAQLLVSHHPLLLTPAHGVPSNDPKGNLVHRLIRAGIGLFVAHTNADVADPGVSDALAACLGLTHLRPLEAQSEQPMDKLVVYVPADNAQRLVDALSAAGAGSIGNYERCAWLTEGTGTFRPRDGAMPAIGHVGQVERVEETRVEMVVPTRLRGEIVAALRSAHPYEEPAFDLLTRSPSASRRGLGRVGDLPGPLTLREFTAYAARALPATVWGVRAAGDPERPVRTVAVAGGACGALAEPARRAGADALLTADLKHHHVVEAVSERGGKAMALVDAAHWATEAPWLDALAIRLRERFGTTVEILVSRRVTDPWTMHAPSEETRPMST